MRAAPTTPRGCREPHQLLLDEASASSGPDMIPSGDDGAEEEDLLPLETLPPELRPRARHSFCLFAERVMDLLLVRWLRPVKYRLFWAGVHLALALFFVLVLALFVVNSHVYVIPEMKHVFMWEERGTRLGGCNELCGEGCQRVGRTV